jgi:hypothetical protein
VQPAAAGAEVCTCQVCAHAHDVFITAAQLYGPLHW